MLYELTATQFALVPRVAEPPMRYRRSGRARKHSVGAAAPTEQIELRVRARDNGARWKRILDLNARVSGSVTGDARVTWLELEELLHEHWLEVALEHFQTGFDSGFVRGARELGASSSLPPSDVLRLLAAVLVRVASELEDDDRR